MPIRRQIYLKAAYIVTLKAVRKKQRKSVHAIQYLEYKDVDGIPIATKWIFWAWEDGKGPMKWTDNTNRYQIC
jgi:hypothetical protein